MAIYSTAPNKVTKKKKRVSHQPGRLRSRLWPLVLVRRHGSCKMHFNNTFSNKRERHHKRVHDCANCNFNNCTFLMRYQPPLEFPRLALMSRRNCLILNFTTSGAGAAMVQGFSEQSQLGAALEVLRRYHLGLLVGFSARASRSWILNFQQCRKRTAAYGESFYSQGGRRRDLDKIPAEGAPTKGPLSMRLSDHV